MSHSGHQAWLFSVSILFMYIWAWGVDYVHLSAGAFIDQKSHIPLDLELQATGSYFICILETNWSPLKEQFVSVHLMAKQTLQLLAQLLMIKYVPKSIYEIQNTNTHILLLCINYNIYIKISFYYLEIRWIWIPYHPGTTLRIAKITGLYTSTVLF